LFNGRSSQLEFKTGGETSLSLDATDFNEEEEYQAVYDFVKEKLNK
jgi:hypothetical protein